MAFFFSSNSLNSLLLLPLLLLMGGRGLEEIDGSGFNSPRRPLSGLGSEMPSRRVGVLRGPTAEGLSSAALLCGAEEALGLKSLAFISLTVELDSYSGRKGEIQTKMSHSDRQTFASADRNSLSSFLGGVSRLLRS